MKVIIAGSRNIPSPDANVLSACSDSKFDITEVVSGCARGVDKAGEALAESLHIPVKRFPANWTHYGKSAGIKRNRVMAQYADALIAVWDGQSRGTYNMIYEMEKLAKPVFIRNVNAWAVVQIEEEPVP